MMRVADYVMEFLVSRGVRNVFMLPGGGAMFLDDALGRNRDLEYTCFLHEQALAIACEAYGQHTNTPGVGLVTSGPGSTNAITGVAAAWIDSTPCVFLSGQAKRQTLKGDSGVRQMGSQEVDIVSMVSCITKYAVTVMEPNDIRFHLEKAWHEATTGRKGPVWLDIPLDVQSTEIDVAGLRAFEPPVRAAEDAVDTGAVDEVVARLGRSRRPLILVGNGVKLAGAGAAVRGFAEKHRIPMLLTWKTADFLDFDHPLNFGFPGGMGSRYANFALQNCDFLLVLGSRLDPSLTAFDPSHFGFRAFKAMVDIDEAEMRKIPDVPLKIRADAADFMRELASRELAVPETSRWLAWCAALKEKYPAVEPGSDGGDAAPVDLYRFTLELCRQLTSDDVIVPESSGSAGEATYQALRVKAGQSIKNAAGLGSMGFGLPYAIGSCIAMDRRRTVLINGDGAFQLNIQELETLKRLELPVAIFIFDNGGYGTIANTQNNLFGGFHVGADPASGLTLPDLVKVAAAYGLETFEIASNGELARGISATLRAGVPALCRVKVRADHRITPRVQSLKLADGTMVSKTLEEMSPLLDAAETAEIMKGPAE